MARIHSVKSARKPQGNCERCQRPLKVGQPYKWCAPGPPRMQRKRKRCATCPSWRPSELTSSSQLATIYAAQENFGDELAAASTVEEIADALRSAADDIRSAAEEYRESASNIEDGFGHPTYQSEELNEKADDIEGWADDIESRADELEDDVSCIECSEPEDEHHDFAEDKEDETKCAAVEGCELGEDDHHEYEVDLGEVDTSVIDVLGRGDASALLRRVECSECRRLLRAMLADGGRRVYSDDEKG